VAGAATRGPILLSLSFADMFQALLLGTASAMLDFAPPVTLPLACPQALCRYGGTTTADSFRALGGAAAHHLVGVVNRTVVHSADSGATWAPVRGPATVGPGVPFALIPGNGSLLSVGNAAINASLLPAPIPYATGTTRGRWDVLPGGHAAAERVAHTFEAASLSWRLPREDLCLFSGYSGTPVAVVAPPAAAAAAAGAGVPAVPVPLLLKTMVLRHNCTAPPAGQGWGVLPNQTSIWLFESPDGGLNWSPRSEVASAASAAGAEEGPNENDIVVAADGSLLVVFRVDGGDGWPDHPHRPFMSTRSADVGLTWAAPAALPDGVLSARPQLLMLDARRGPLLLTGGRPHLMLWASADGTGRTWDAAYNLAGEHNARQPDAALRFCDAFANGTSAWLESTCYNSLQRVADDGAGRPRALVCYDRMGTESPVAPAACQPALVNTFCMQISMA